MREHGTLTLDLTDDDLSFAIGLLRGRLPEVVCPRAWGILIVEQDRRCETKGLAKFPIIMAASAYAELPHEVARSPRCAKAAANDYAERAGVSHRPASRVWSLRTRATISASQQIARYRSK